jgi:osmotically-inducible protein OsmY
MALLALAAALAAASQSQSAGAPQRASKVPAWLKKVRNDAEMERAIRKRFAESKIAVNKFEVLVKDGVAILRGRTDVIQHKATATRLARSVGARDVVNKIEITERARQKASSEQRRRPRHVSVKRSEAGRP